jgi:hypothetical protein
VRLLYTTDAFSQHGVPMVGVPVILNNVMHIAEGPQRWLFYIALDRGRTRSPATWRSYAEALFDWLQTCQVNGWAWDEVEEGHLRAYRNQMLYHPSSVTGRAYSTRTVNGRLRRLAMFYNWAFRQGLIARVPFEYDTVRAPISADAQLLAHLRTSETLPAVDLTVRETGLSRRRFRLRTSGGCAVILAPVQVIRRIQIRRGSGRDLTLPAVTSCAPYTCRASVGGEHAGRVLHCAS